MKLATTIGEMYRFTSSPAEAVRSYKGTGFRYLDYSFYYDCRETSPFMADDDSLWRSQVDAAADAAADCGFTFVQAHAPACNPVKEVDYERSIRAVCRTVDACGRLNIPVTVIHTSYGRPHLYPMDKIPYFEYNKKFLAPILERAEKYGITVCIENTSTGNMGSFYFPRTPEEMNEFVDFIGHPLLKCCWDTGHGVMEGHFDQYDDLQKFGSNLRAVHIHDNCAASDEHLLPYCGKLDLDSIVKGLIDARFPGYFTFEADGAFNRTGSTGPLQKMPLEIRQQALSLLYNIGKFLLESYNVFED